MTTRAFAPGERLQARFVVGAFEGDGPLGERWLAVDEESGIEVQLRVVHLRLLEGEAERAAFVARMQRLLSLSHPHLLRVHAAFEAAGHAVLAVQHVTGATLADPVRAARPQSFEESRPLLGQIAAALAHAHAHGVVLGDLRPKTVVTLEGGVKITSVGLPLALPRERYLEAVAAEAEHAHLAPELRRGAPCDVRADVYSFAALVTTVLCGKPLEAARARPGDVPASLVLTLERNLDGDPARRSPTVEALLSALDRGHSAARGRGGPVTLPPNVTSPARPPSPSQAARVAQPTPTSDFDERREVTRQVDEDELKRLAGEVSDLLETTRQVSLDEIGLLRAQPGVGRDEPLAATREPSGRSRRPTGSTPVVGSGSGPRPRAPVGLIEEDDDLDFDLGPARPARVGPPSQEVTRAETPPRRPPEQPLAVAPPSPPMIAREAVASHAAVEARAAAPEERSDDGEATSLQFAAQADPFAVALEAAHHAQPEAERAADRAADRARPPALPFPDDELLDGDLLEDDSPTSTFGAAAAPPSASGDPFADAMAPLVAPRPSPTPREVGRVAAAPPSVFDAPRPVPRDLHAEPYLDPRATIPMSALGVARPAPAQPSAAEPAARPRSRARLYGAVGLAVVAVAGFAVGAIERSAPPHKVARVAAVSSESGPDVATAVGAPAAATAANTPTAATTTSAPPPGKTATTATTANGATAKGGAAALANGAAPAAKSATSAAAPPGGAAVAAAALESGGCPAGMVRAPGHPAFCIDAFEYPGQGQLPKTAVTRDEAAKLCAARNARLCTGHEWELACRGKGGASYPYGASYQASACNTAAGSLLPAGSLASCRSGVGAFDMSGNAAEWTDSGVRGGAVGEGNPAGRCSQHARGTSPSSTGFRCCAGAR